MVDRLDEERIEILRRWGAGLALDGREELRAAGKAITVLIEEIDLLLIDLWNTRVERDEQTGAPVPGLAETLSERLVTRRTTPPAPRSLDAAGAVELRSPATEAPAEVERGKTDRRALPRGPDGRDRIGADRVEPRRTEMLLSVLSATLHGGLPVRKESKVSG